MGGDTVLFHAGHAALASVQALFHGHTVRQEAPEPTSDHSGLVIGVVFASLVVTTVTIAGRILIRKTMPPNRFFMDDGLVLIASLLTIGLCMVSLEGTRHGLGKHEGSLANRESEVKDTIMLMWVGQLLYAFGISIAKCGIISSYFRIFPYKRLHQIIWVVLAVTIAFIIAAIFGTIFICRPIQAAWDPRLRTPTSCYRIINLLYASAVINLLTDVILCIAPLPYFLKLPLPLKQKISASVLFVAGGSAAIASALRLGYLNKISDDGSDITYNIAQPLIWSVLECSISIITISIPPMRPLFAKLAPSIFVANAAEDHKKFMSRISRHLRLEDGLAGSIARRVRSRSSSAMSTSMRPILDDRRASTATIESVRSSYWPGQRERDRDVVREETIVEEKV